MVTIISTIILLGILIFVHELGHFLMAKLLGVKVERFSLGFPPKMIGKKIGETEYMLSWIPLGGYVKMFGENPDEEEYVPPEEEHRSFSHKPAWARFLIVLAGPGFNFLFAFLVLWGLFAVNGVDRFKPEVGRVAEGTPAAEAGLEPGDRIVALDGRPIKYFEEILDKVMEGAGQTMQVTVDRGGRTFTKPITPGKSLHKNLFGEDVEVFDIGIEPYMSAYVAEVNPDMPAFAAGIQPGDLITTISEKPVRDWYDVLDLIRASKGRQVTIGIQRNGRDLTVEVTPKLVPGQDLAGEQIQTPMIGIGGRDERILEEVGPIKAIYYGAARTWELTRLTVISVVKLFQRKVSVKTLGGPIFIAELAGKQAKAGLVHFISLMAYISLSLGILNLLPIPVLDGGHLLFFLLEMIFRRPVSLNIREKAQQAGMLFLLLFMVFVFYNDIARIATRWSQESNPAPITEQNESTGTGNVDSTR